MLLSNGSFYNNANAGGGAVSLTPAFSKVVLLLGFEGSDGATTFTDESSGAKTGTAVGNAQIDTAAFKFGSASGLFDGSGDAIGYSDSTDWYWPGEFTIEAWVRPQFASAATGGIANQWSNITGTCYWRFGYTYSNATNKNFVFEYSPTGSAPSGVTSISAASSNIDQSVFHHIAVSRDASDKIRMFLDGTMVASATVSGGADISQAMRLGTYVGSASSSMNGWIDELRIVKGFCCYPSDAGLVVPTGAFPRS